MIRSDHGRRGSVPQREILPDADGIGVGAKPREERRPAGRLRMAQEAGPRCFHSREDGGDHRRLAFGLLYLFTLLLYARPNDLIPAMGTFPLAKIVAILAPLAYVYAQYKVGDPIIKWTIEVKMVIVMLLLAVILTRSPCLLATASPR